LVEKLLNLFKMEIENTEPQNIETLPTPALLMRTWGRFVWGFGLKVTRNTLIFLGSIIISILLLLQIPFFQTVIIKQAFVIVSDVLKFKIETKSAYINVFTSKAFFKDLSVRDRQGKPMIFIEDLRVDFEYDKVIKNGNVYLHDIVLKGGSINFRIDKKTNLLNIDDFIETIDSLTAPKVRNPKAAPTMVIIKKAKIIDTYFGYTDERKPYTSQPNFFNPLRFGIDNLHAEVDDLSIVGDSVDVQISDLQGIEYQSDLRLHKLNTQFRFTEKTMQFKALNAHLNHTFLRDSIIFQYNHPRDLSDFVEKVHIKAHLDSTVIDTDDLAKFAPEVKQYDDVWRISGNFVGRVNDFDLKNLDLYLGKQSHVIGEASFAGLPDTKQTFMNLQFRQAQVLASELDPYIDQTEVSPFLQKLGLVNFKASVTGFFADFVANGDFKTSLGNLTSDIKLQLKKNIEQSYYKGYLKTDQFDLGTLVGVDKLGKIDITGTIEGTGFSPEFAKFKLDAQVDKLAYNNYEYQNIQVDGALSRQQFDGEMIAKDDNFNFEINGALDFNRKGQDPQSPAGNFKLKSKIYNIDLKKLNFSPIEAIIHGDLSLDTHGLTLDDLTGNASLTDALIVYGGKDLKIKELDFLSFYTDEGKRLFQINSDYLDFEANGNFLFSNVFADIEELLEEYLLSFQNQPKKIAEYYQAKQKRLPKEIKRYGVDFEFEFKNANPLLAIFNDKFFVSNYSEIKGSFARGKSTSLKIFTETNLDSVFYDSYKFYDIGIDVNTSKIVNTPEILAEGTITSNRQSFRFADTEKMLLNAVWGENAINFNLQAKQSGNTNSADLAGLMRFVGDTTLVSFQASKFQFLNEWWGITKGNEINLNPQDIVFSNLAFFKEKNKGSLISLEGKMSDTLKVRVQDFEVFSFANFFNQDIHGVLNAELDMLRLQSKPEVKGQLGLENLLYDKILIGDVEGRVNWLDSLQKMSTDINLYRRGRYILDLRGDYKPNLKENALDLIAEFEKTDLEIVEPFVKDLISKLKGDILGKLTIKGTLEDPKIRGNLTVENGQFKLNYLNTLYQMDGDVAFLKGEIKASNVVLLDEFSNPATANASIYHDRYRDFYLLAKAKFYDFQLLNTTEKDNSLYYGEAYATGDLKMEGFLSNLKLNVNARSRKGTSLVLPLDGYEEVGQKDYIEFVKLDSKKDSTNINRIDLGGMQINFNLEVNPDAEIRILFDKNTGDMIWATGRGNIEMNVDTEGEFAMFGSYIIDKGKYNFTFSLENYNLLNKGFDIQKGSTITFNGDVYKSVLDIKALYNKNVSLKSLVDIQNVDANTARDLNRFYPATAVLGMKGEFLTPEIKIGLDLEEAKKLTINNSFLQSALLQLETQIQTNEQVRNQQVFSLLILNRLSSINSFSGVGGGAGSSLSELLSNQFSNWLSQVDENLELSFNLDPSNLNTFQMRVSYNLLDGRIRITRDGGFTNSRSQTDFTSLIGDWTLEYLLSNSGKYRLKAYNRTNQNLLNSVNLGNGGATTIGFSLLHTANFNRLEDLFTSRKKREAEEKIKLERIKESQSEESFIEFSPKIKSDSTQTSNPLELIKQRERESMPEPMPLKHRQDRYQNSKRIIAENAENPDNEGLNSNQSLNPTTQNANPKNQYLEGDVDNEPMPEKYRPQNNEQPNSNNQITTENKPKLPHNQAFPLKHRFDKLNK
jgi:phage regulator Rha-like protein